MMKGASLAIFCYIIGLYGVLGRSSSKLPIPDETHHSPINDWQSASELTFGEADNEGSQSRVSRGIVGTETYAPQEANGIEDIGDLAVDNAERYQRVVDAETAELERRSQFSRQIELQERAARNAARAARAQAARARLVANRVAQNANAAEGNAAPGEAANAAENAVAEGEANVAGNAIEGAVEQNIGEQVFEAIVDEAAADVIAEDLAAEIAVIAIL